MTSKMQILVKRADFSTRSYELFIEDAGLRFFGEGKDFSVPYQEVSDFCVTENNQGKIWFSMISGGRMHEGQVLDAEDVETFAAALREKLGGVIHIEVKRS